MMWERQAKFGIPIIPGGSKSCFLKFYANFIICTLWTLIDGGGWNSMGGLEKISKINSRGGWNNRGVGKNTMQ